MVGLGRAHAEAQKPKKKPLTKDHVGLRPVMSKGVRVITAVGGGSSWDRRPVSAHTDSPVGKGIKRFCGVFVRSTDYKNRVTISFVQSQFTTCNRSRLFAFSQNCYKTKALGLEEQIQSSLKKMGPNSAEDQKKHHRFNLVHSFHVRPIVLHTSGAPLSSASSGTNRL